MKTILKEAINNLASIPLAYSWHKNKLEIFKNPEHFNKIILDEIIKVPKIDLDKTKRIIIGSLRSQGHSNLFEGALAGYLKNCGYDVKLLRCGQYLDKCETKSHFRDHQLACSMCHKEFDVFSKVFGIDSISLKDLISIKSRNEILNYCQKHNLQNDPVWDGINLKAEWGSALQRYYLGIDMHLETKSKIARQFLYTTIINFEAGRELICFYASYRPTVLKLNY